MPQTLLTTDRTLASHTRSTGTPSPSPPFRTLLIHGLSRDSIHTLLDRRPLDCRTFEDEREISIRLVRERDTWIGQRGSFAKEKLLCPLARKNSKATTREAQGANLCVCCEVASDSSVIMEPAGRRARPSDWTELAGKLPSSSSCYRAIIIPTLQLPPSSTL